VHLPRILIILMIYTHTHTHTHTYTRRYRTFHSFIRPSASSWRLSDDERQTASVALRSPLRSIRDTLYTWGQQLFYVRTYVQHVARDSIALYIAVYPSAAGRRCSIIKCIAFLPSYLASRPPISGTSRLVNYRLTSLRSRVSTRTSRYHCPPRCAVYLGCNS